MGRMYLIFRVLLVAVLMGALGTANAQKAGAHKTPDQGCKPPLNRQLRHDFVDQAQQLALRADGKADNEFYAGNNPEVNFQVTQTITRRVDNLQCVIENDTLTRDQKKVAYLKGLEVILKNFAKLYRNRQVLPSHLPAVFDAYEAAMALDERGASIVPVIERSSYEVGNFLIGSQGFDANSGRAEAKNIVLSKYLAQHPDRILATLKDNTNLPNRDSLIILAAYRNPAQLYDYASANNDLGYFIRRMDDSLVRTVSRMATSGGAGQKQLPFLDNILRGKITLEQVNAVKDDPVKYYKLLVRTRIDYVQQQVQQKDTVMGMKAINDMLRRRAMDPFINTINGLHEEPDAKRFKVLQELSATELYYLIVIGGEELYTSSYVRGVFPLMMQKSANRGDSLLMSVSFDRFKKFIKMAAGYNTLDDFLASFPNKGNAEALMTEFVNGLEKTQTLEDGVDVADSYASIVQTNKDMAARMLANVQANLERNRARNNQRGIVLYNLLDKLFRSADSTSKIDLSKEFGVPPVYTVDYNSLLADTNRVFVQAFFYGDKDGVNNYNIQVAQLARTGWKKIEDTKQWQAWASTTGKPVTLYFNKPLDEESGELERAQAALDDHLSGRGIQPTVVIHRGHSYYAGATIDQIQPAAKIVFLGSCGGYHLIHDVLEHAPDAHIVASKQTGFNVINQNFLNLMFSKLREGKTIEWIPFWKEFEKNAGKLAGFEDYIPPHRNLGAIFIKAYNSQMGAVAYNE
ncbi:hypothetical protein EPD60_03310 [Flaviaesturariibacter flavus]|uniref:Uncharacterized protein n=1 Tax=Flaviaesturariibacter flavus TaxID=2502780 RepID=A0A4V2NWU9_9BACT|nr:hypothetical protein [Flaviaesturariibacter flavus]TCJ18802.1 hypothetical protein EPD60_03310 [Flaviaesturariibacter flavus]